MKHITYTTLFILTTLCLLGTAGPAYALDNDPTPKLLSGAYMSVGYRHEPQQTDDAEARVGFDINAWLFSTAMGTAVGLEWDAELGFQLIDAIRLPFKTSLGLAIAPLQLSEWQVILHANVACMGYDGTSWDTGARLTRDLGLRLITADDVGFMLAYFWRKPFGWLEQGDRLERNEHHIQLKVGFEGDDVDEGILLHGTVGRTSLNNQEPTMDYRLALAYIWAF